MKRLSLWSFVITATWIVTGCDDGHSERGCIADVECAPGYVCDLAGNECRRPTEACAEPSDCGTNETCGSDRVCRTGDCSFHGCVVGFSCEIVDARYACVRSSKAKGAASGVNGTVGSGGAASAEAGGPTVAGSGAAGEGGAAESTAGASATKAAGSGE